MFVKIGNREELQKQSGLGLHCLSGHFWQATSVRIFRTSTIVIT